MRLAPEIEEFWRKFAENAKEYQATEPEDEEISTYTDRETISQTWQTKSKLVRLDDCILALHIMSARHSFRGLTKLKAKLLNSLRQWFEGLLGSALATRLVGKVFSRLGIASLGAVAAKTIDESALQVELESSVRVSSFEVRADLYSDRQMKPNPSRIRKRKLVYTRNG